MSSSFLIPWANSGFYGRFGRIWGGDIPEDIPVVMSMRVSNEETVPLNTKCGQQFYSLCALRISSTSHRARLVYFHLQIQEYPVHRGRRSFAGVRNVRPLRPQQPGKPSLAFMSRLYKPTEDDVVSSRTEKNGEGNRNMERPVTCPRAFLLYVLSWV